MKNKVVFVEVLHQVTNPFTSVAHFIFRVVRAGQPPAAPCPQNQLPPWLNRGPWKNAPVNSPARVFPALLSPATVPANQPNTPTRLRRKRPPRPIPPTGRCCRCRERQKQPCWPADVCVNR